MTVDKLPNVAQILDGQHRIKGLENYTGPRFELNVAIFVDMDQEEQALLFATINLKQTKVSKSLAYDLFDFARTRSPQKTAHNIVRLLNSRRDSPFYHRIRILGEATKGRDETLTQAGFVDRLLPLISTKPAADRDTIKRGSQLPPTPEAEQRRLVFRELFRLDRDSEIAMVIWEYFSAVSVRWPRAWGEVRSGHILNRTTGFAALMRVLPDALNVLKATTELPRREQFLPLFRKVPLGDDDFTRERYLPGATGQKELVDELSRAIHAE